MTEAIDWSQVPWTPFQPATQEDGANVLYRAGDNEPPAHVFINSRYIVSAWFDGAPDFPVWGEWVHLSIKTLNRQAYHDWRDFQRIKNEIVGEEFDAVEIYPAEDKLVDTANQYHLFVFASLRFPFGFQERLVADGSPSQYAPKAEQREFEVRPKGCLSGADLDAIIVAAMQKNGGEDGRV